MNTLSQTPGLLLCIQIRQQASLHIILHDNWVKSLNHWHIPLSVGLATPHVQHPWQKEGEKRKKREDGGESRERDKKSLNPLSAQWSREGGKRTPTWRRFTGSNTHTHIDLKEKKCLFPYSWNLHTYKHPRCLTVHIWAEKRGYTEARIYVSTAQVTDCSI